MSVLVPVTVLDGVCHFILTRRPRPPIAQRARRSLITLDGFAAVMDVLTPRLLRPRRHHRLRPRHHLTATFFLRCPPAHPVLLRPPRKPGRATRTTSSAPPASVRSALSRSGKASATPSVSRTKPPPLPRPKWS